LLKIKQRDGALDRFASPERFDAGRLLGPAVLSPRRPIREVNDAQLFPGGRRCRHRGFNRHDTIKGDFYDSPIGDCSFDTYEQCLATASGRKAYCDANPFFAYAEKRRALLSRP
jgi:Protein of unknown function (DUF3551)